MRRGSGESSGSVRVVAGCVVCGLVAGLVGCTPSTGELPAPTPYQGDLPLRVTGQGGREMVLVPAGEFVMGKADADHYANDDEKPQHTVTLDAFWIDQTEVTNAQYRRCVEAGTCPEPTCERYWEEPTYGDPAMADYPVVCVDWNAASVYCEWAGARLPTEAEWEKAARGTDGRRYPWGNAFDSSRVNFCDRTCEYDYGNTDAYDGYPRSALVGSFPGGASPYGALDMVGNVSEWVADWHNASYYGRSPARDPQGPDAGVYKVMRGGSWHTREARVHTACRTKGYPSSTYFNVGFRCAKQCE